MTRGRRRRWRWREVLPVAGPLALIAAVLVGGVVWLASDVTVASEWAVSAFTWSDTGDEDERFTLTPKVRRIPITIAAGCWDQGEYRLDRVETKETENEVIITAYVRMPRGDSGEDCLRSVGATVPLDAPLGDRQLLDGRTDPPSRPQRHL